MKWKELSLAEKGWRLWQVFTVAAFIALIALEIGGQTKIVDILDKPISIAVFLSGGILIRKNKQGSGVAYFVIAALQTVSLLMHILIR